MELNNIAIPYVGMVLSEHVGGVTSWQTIFYLLWDSLIYA
jgi:hypothetical protein